MENQPELKGIWFLPGKPLSRFSGTLQFGIGEGGLLELISSFEDIQEAFGSPDQASAIIQQTPIILGTSSDGKNITLFECFVADSRSSSLGALILSIKVSTVFIGAHFSKPDEIVFKQIAVNYSNLDHWVNISGFNTTHDPDHFWRMNMSFNP